MLERQRIGIDAAKGDKCKSPGRQPAAMRQRDWVRELDNRSIIPTRRELLAATAAAGVIGTLPATLSAAQSGEAIRPFTVNIPQEELDELRRRVAATRLPDREPVTDFSQGVPLATIQKLAQYCANDYDWRRSKHGSTAIRTSSPRLTGWTSTLPTSAQNTLTRCR